MLKRPHLRAFSGVLTAFLTEGGINIPPFNPNGLKRQKTPLNAVCIIVIFLGYYVRHLNIYFGWFLRVIFRGFLRVIFRGFLRGLFRGFLRGLFRGFLRGLFRGFLRVVDGFK